MMEFTEKEVKELYASLDLTAVVMGLDQDRDNPEYCGRVLYGMIEHSVFLTGRAIFLGYNYTTRHITIFNNIVGKPEEFVISCAENFPSKVASSTGEIVQAHDKLIKDLYFYQKLNAELSISEALANLD